MVSRVVTGLALVLATQAWGQDVDFHRDIRPILSDSCFVCHGPDEGTRQARLRLDTFEGATAQRNGTEPAIIPGDADASLFIQRVFAHDDADRMPPPESGKVLSAEQKAALRTWIAEGAVYKPHWSFVPPEPPAVPPVERVAWSRNTIDQFILARLEDEGLEPSPEADKATLLRRVSLDLTGLPPTPEALEVFLADPSPLAYDRAVQRLLDSPSYGERWARVWLDLARYADTKGYEKDDRREIWRYRDWVINAFNDDMPFDQFTVEQMAGDLLPNPTLEQRLATAFHRNTMTNDEGGTDDEEFRTAAVVDRVNTTMTVWMGLTMACAQCHTHKYDPITHHEYFQMFAIFNQTEDRDAYPVEVPVMPTPTPAQQRDLALIDGRLDAIASLLREEAPRRPDDFAAWQRHALEEADSVKAGPWYSHAPILEDNFDVAFDTAYPPEEAIRIDAADDTGAALWTKQPAWTDGEVIELDPAVGSTYVYRVLRSTGPRTLNASFGSNDAIRVWLNGEAVLSNKVERTAHPDQEQATLELAPGENHLLLKIVNVGGAAGFYFRYDDATLPAEVIAALRLEEAERDPKARRLTEEYFARQLPEFQGLWSEQAALEAERKAIVDAIVATPILNELPVDKRRETHVHIRGNFLDHGDRVEPGVPEIFHPLPEGMEPNRLSLAHWLVDERNPLTARVTVNRYWEIFFGRGLVETSEDFGLQGQLPSHPELLDWLAVEFMASGWSMKELCRTIVTSNTYRQSSTLTPDLIERDPYNRLYARGPRFRLEAEAIRDQALAVAGLLSPTLGGPSVMPPQPEGIWQVVYSSDRWITSADEDRYRRGLYTFIRRTSPYPSMATFDAPSREVCTVRRINTNTPLQALVTLNDPVFIEAAQALARRAVMEADDSAEAVAGHAMRLALARPASPAEVNELVKLYRSELDHYGSAPEAALAMATDPLGPLPESMAAAELAAWTVVCNVILNLDELLTRI